MIEKMVGCAFVSAAAELALAGSRFSKYVKTVLGIIFIIIILGEIPLFPEINLENIRPEEEDFISARERFNEKLNEQVMSNAEKKILEKLSQEGIEPESMTIDFDENYSIKQIKIYPKNEKDSEKIINILNSYFEIDKEVIEICGG